MNEVYSRIRFIETHLIKFANIAKGKNYNNIIFKKVKITPVFLVLNNNLSKKIIF